MLLHLVLTTQPTMTVNRKTLGELAIKSTDIKSRTSPVTAGSNRDFTFTYKASATEALAGSIDDDGDPQLPDVIEIRLPPNWPSPTPYNFNLDNKLVYTDEAGVVTMLKDATGPHVYLDGSLSRLLGAGISVIDGGGVTAPETPDGTGIQWVRLFALMLGEKGVSRGNTIVLKYDDVTVQREVATGDDGKIGIQTFSGPSAASLASDTDLPQFPVAKMDEDTIEVKLAADGSGKVTFEFENFPVATLGDKNHNAADSIPAGITKDDVRDLIISYTPDGDMDEGEFEVRLPSGWKAEEIFTSGPINTTTKTGDPVHTVAVDFLSNFGVAEESIDITLVDVTVPNKHGNNGFRSKSKSKGGSLKQLSPIPAAFVGNTMADNDTVKVEIDPAEAYQNQENVDFEITVEANGPMHDSEIQITVPDGLSDLQEDSAKANYVRKVSAPVSGVDVTVDNDVINITTGKLNPGGKIKVRFDNVNLKDISTDPDLGFRVGTRTRTDIPAGEEETAGDLSGEDFEPIENADGTRSIEGGLIRTVAGSGTMAVEPATIEQGSRNKNIKLTFTATTDFEKLNLAITAPPVIDTELHEDKSSDDGYVSTPNAAKLHEDDTDNDLKVSGNVITWGMLTLNRGEKFVTNIKRVDLLEDTGNAQWDVELGDVDITVGGLAAANPPMVVVGTMEDDVVFEVVDESDIPNSNPSYPASSLQSIRFKFTTENTAIQAGGRLWFTIPVGWSLPSLTDKTGKATVSIVDQKWRGNSRRRWRSNARQTAT